MVHQFRVILFCKLHRNMRPTTQIPTNCNSVTDVPARRSDRVRARAAPAERTTWGGITSAATTRLPHRHQLP